MTSSHPSEGGRGRRFLAKFLLHVVLPAAVLVGAWLGARHLIATAPSTPKKPRARSVRTVEVVEVERTSKAPTLEAMGVVKPAREVTVRPRISGAILTIADRFEPGGRFFTDDPLVCLDRADFDLAVLQAEVSESQAKAAKSQAEALLAQAEATLRQRSATLAKARADLQLEAGNQAIARREYEMLEGAKNGANPDLVLRTPQLAIAKATVSSAEAGVVAAQAGIESAHAGVNAAAASIDVAASRLAQAELDRTRTCMKAPFNAWIRERYVEVGAVVGPNTNVATLVGTDTYWVEVTLPVSDLRWLHLRDEDDEEAEEGASVTIRDEAAWGPEAARTGRVLRLLGDLESAGRLARLLVVVEDPLHLEAEPTRRLPLLTGSYVRVEIEGRAMGNVLELDRSWLRHGDVIWVVDAEGLLRIRVVEIRWRGREKLFVGSGLELGDRVITTDLEAPVDGTPVQVRTKGDAQDRERP